MSTSSPSFRVVTASRLEPLFDRMAGAMEAEPLDPLARETIVVAQNVGLRAWVQRTLAHRLGVAASLDLRSPRDLATSLARALPDSGAAREQHPFDAGPLAWRLDAILGDLPDDPLWEPLRAYLGRTGGQTMPLATRLAALFDDYQVYRPDVLCGWVAGGAPPDDFAHGPWQAALWRRLVADEPGTRDRASEMLALLDALADPGDRLRAAFPTGRVSVFGALLFPPVYLQVLRALARHVTVTVYAVVPGAPTGERTHAHPLLRALAGRSRDYGAVLSDLDPDGYDRLDAASASDTALGRLQAALATDAASAPLQPDVSVRVHDCHSPTRELEALRDSLLDAFAEVEGLRPSDVLVLVPDLGVYAPLVDAVFGAEDAAPDLRIPYHVAEHPHAPALRVVEAFTRSLRLHDGRVTASELLDLLGTPVIRNAAGISEDELPRLRSWVQEAGICWGLDAERKVRFGLPEDDLHTWRFGLDRLLLGVMAGGAEGLVLGHLPCDVVGEDGADLLGRFCEWAEALFRSLEAIDRPAPLADWPGRLLTFLDGVFDAREDEELEAVVFLREQALEVGKLASLVEDAEAVSFRTVRSHLDGAAGRFQRREPYLTGRVTVADPMTLRHAPHRVVAFLGLGDGMWPRQETPPGFDLLAYAPRPGDASPRSEEKQLFLDAVFAARDRLILSTVGRSQKDNAPRAASVCLDAFLDAVGRPEGLVVQHRLQPFAADYFTSGGPLASYAAQHRVRPAEAPDAFLDPDETLTEVEDRDALALDELASAWTNPSRYVVRHRLRVGLGLDDDAVRDDEPVALGGLDKWRVRQAVLDALLDDLDDAAIAERLLRCGLLPGGAPGRSWLRQTCDEAAPLAEAVRSWGATEPRSVDLEVSGIRLVGTVRRVNTRGALRYRAGTVRQKDLVAAWIDHLALEAGEPVGCTYTVGTRESAYFTPVEPEHARGYLAALVKGWRRAQRRSLPLYEHASYAYAKALTDGERAEYAERVRAEGRSERPFLPPAKAMGQARSAYSPFKGRPDAPPGDDDDPYVVLATRGRDPFVPEDHFMKWALGLWAPLLHHRQEGTPG